MSELTANNHDIVDTTQLPEERVDFVPEEIVHFEPVLPKIDIKGAEPLGSLGESHTEHVQAIGGVNIDAEAVKVLPEHLSNEVLIGKGDVDKSSSWLREVRNRVSKLKGAA